MFMFRLVSKPQKYVIKSKPMCLLYNTHRPINMVELENVELHTHIHYIHT